jgi:hypothetical protein
LPILNAISHDPGWELVKCEPFRIVASSCYVCGMHRQRISTTVDPGVLAAVRALEPDAPLASLVERAFEALLQAHRRSEVDAAYARAYADHPQAEHDEWGDLASFGDAVRHR